MSDKEYGGPKAHSKATPTEVTCCISSSGWIRKTGKGTPTLTTSDLDIYRTANLLIEQFGADDAPLIAARRADALLGLGDLDGQRVWKSVLRAIEELTRATPRLGERVN
jgi:hypothetical protein